MSRDPLDRYYTPPELAAACVEILHERHGLFDAPALRVLEPSSGRGAWLAALHDGYREHGPRTAGWGLSLVAVDLDPEAEQHAQRAGASAFIHGDFLDVRRMETSEPWTSVTLEAPRQPVVHGMHPAQWVIGNPPFSDAQRHVDHALTLAPCVAFILRAGFLGSAKRLDWWQENTPEAYYTIVPRPSFTEGGADVGEYILAVWERGRHASRMGWARWDKAAADRRCAVAAKAKREAAAARAHFNQEPET